MCVCAYIPPICHIIDSEGDALQNAKNTRPTPSSFAEEQRRKRSLRKKSHTHLQAVHNNAKYTYIIIHPSIRTAFNFFRSRVAFDTQSFPFKFANRVGYLGVFKLGVGSGRFRGETAWKSLHYHIFYERIRAFRAEGLCMRRYRSGSEIIHCWDCEYWRNNSGGCLAYSDVIIYQYG